MEKSVTLVAAMGLNRAIGLQGKMPWHLPAELQHFKRTTMDKSIVMGRKTWQSIGRPLPGRQNIVVSRNPDFTATGADVVDSLEAAIEISNSAEVMVIGGGQLYSLALERASRMVLTMIEITPQADTWFPEWQAEQWQQTAEQSYPANDKNGLAYRIVEYTRIKS